MREKKEKSARTRGLLSNCWYLLKIAFKLEPALFWTRIPLILVKAALPFIPIVFLRLILNGITAREEEKDILLYVLAFALFTFAGGMLEKVLESRSGIRMETALRKLKNFLGGCVMRMPYGEAEQPKMRDFVLLAKEGTELAAIFENVAAMVVSVLTLFGVASIVITVQPMIFLLVLVVVALRLWADGRNLKLWDKWRPVYAPVMRKGNYLIGVMRGSIYGKEVRLNHLEDWLDNKLADSAEEYMKTCTGLNLALQRNNAFPELAAIFQECIVYLILAYRVVFKGMLIGDFSMYMTSINTFSDRVRQVVASFSELVKNGLFVQDFRRCVELSGYTGGKTEAEIVEEERGASGEAGPLVLEFRNVSFHYPNARNMVLEHVSLTLREGESLSIVGVNGAGKTTFIKLLCRLYEPTEGEILLNGRNIAEIPYEEYVRRLGVVFQDFKLFAFSMEENITMGLPASGDTIEQCVEKCGLETKLQSLPQGLQTNISKEFDESGVQFSGGEGQKLALARVLYKNVPVIVLDEPTAALDPLAEYELYSKFHEIVKGKCAVYISHRLSSTRFTDKIAVFDQGHMAEYGTHKELMEIPGGVYASLFQMQAQYYT